MKESVPRQLPLGHCPGRASDFSEQPEKTLIQMLLNEGILPKRVVGKQPGCLLACTLALRF